MKAIETKEGPIYIPDADTHFATYGHRLCSYQQKVYDRALFLIPGRPESVESNFQAVDIGAHVGLFTRRMARDFKSVIAFEPDKENFECLKVNAGDNVIGHMKALSNYHGTGSLKNPSPINSGAWELKDGWSVNVSKLDNHADLQPSLIKIDTQGSELKILQGAVEILKEYHPVMIIEVKLNNVESKDIYEFMKGLGYELGPRYNKDQIFV